MKSPILPFPTTAPAIKDLVEPFLASKSRTLGPSSRLTVLSYRQTLAKFSKTFGNRGPGSLTPAEIASYWQGLVTNKGEPLAPATANRVLATLSAFMTWVADQGIAARNPVNGLSKMRLSDRDPGAMSEATRQEVLDRAKRRGLREHALVAAMMATGLRIREALNLNVGDVSLDELAVLVRSGKGAKGRRVFITPEVRSIVRRYLRDRPVAHPADPLFQSNRGTRLSYQRAEAVFREVAAGLFNLAGERLHLHSLRHHFATTQLGRGMSPVHLQTLMGHTDARTLVRYVRGAQEAAAETDYRTHNR